MLNVDPTSSREPYVATKTGSQLLSSTTAYTWLFEGSSLKKRSIRISPENTCTAEIGDSSLLSCTRYLVLYSTSCFGGSSRQDLYTSPPKNLDFEKMKKCDNNPTVGILSRKTWCNTAVKRHSTDVGSTSTPLVLQSRFGIKLLEI